MRSEESRHLRRKLAAAMWRGDRGDANNARRQQVCSHSSIEASHRVPNHVHTLDCSEILLHLLEIELNLLSERGAPGMTRSGAADSVAEGAP